MSPITSAIIPPVSSIMSPITSAIIPPVSSVVSGITSGLPSITSDIPISTPSSLPGSTSILPPISEPSVSATPSGPFSSLPASSVIISSAAPTISFPGPPANASTTTSAPHSTPTQSGVTVTSTAVNTFPIAPGLSFVLTESSLAFASVPTTTAALTLTDPDEATTTEAIPTASALTNSVPLPTGIPARIFPREQLDPGTDLSGYTLISILFNNELNWPFVVTSPLSSSQIFAYVPVLLTTALGITSDQVKTYCLQVYIPTTYRSPSDAALLGTTWLGYIPSQFVDTLAAEIKAKTSAFYTGVPDGVAKDLANRVVPGYPIRSVADPNGGPGGGGSDGSGGSGAQGDNGKSRQDAIIGVVSALGAIALLVLVFLVYRSMKRRRQLAHRRLSDPPDEVLGARPDGRQFDQDSVGGARRRSFYYAEDSLRGYEDRAGTSAGAQEQLMQDPGPSTISQRRNVVPASISAPVLRGSTMNW
ncbi:hypothetical protein P691DRAFT_464796 [Macrolepiota fuliginosa MF-IS2]|uniref:Uncharacterized protein n=1 Tax=Macrolepiota fuliginosa MF-IS2 TaxID=1400762 RepID=A0A9P6BWA2_9AGAR|nr:hypothetical protein P691DRAFT_464796 [Macrolepiota fuliginosa MF-IS2]